MGKFCTNSGQISGKIWHGPPYSTFREGIIRSTICKGIIFKFHPPEFVDDIIHSTFYEGIIFQFHPQKNPKIQISKFQNSSCFQRVPFTSVPSPVHFPGFTLTWFDISRNWSQPLLPPSVFVTLAWRVSSKTCHHRCPDGVFHPLVIRRPMHHVLTHTSTHHTIDDSSWLNTGIPH